MERFQKEASLKPYFDAAYGFAVFDTIAKAGIGIGGATGTGIVYEIKRDNSRRHEFVKAGTSQMFQASFGFQFGGQVYSQIVFFESEKDFRNFTAGNFEFAADANVVVLTASASAKLSTLGNQDIQIGMDPEKISTKRMGQAPYTKGMAVFSITKAGIMYEATVSGQNFSFTPSAAA